MSEIKVNKISPRTNCGTVQLGDSGDTITIPAGATITNNGTQTGFGRTGTVNWQTTPKTGNFTAASGEGYFIDTTSGAITMIMPSGSAGSIVSIQDYNKTFDNNTFTIQPASGQKLNGGTADGDLTITTEGQGLTFVYVDSTVGWKTVHENEFIGSGSDFIDATGGTISNTPTCRIHTFTGPGTFTVNATAASAPSNVVSYLVVAGGGGGGGGSGGGSTNTAAGGGAGGFREYKSPVTPYTASPLDGNPGGTAITVSAQSYPITVGGGGATQPSPQTQGNNGSDSIFSTVTSTGGGGGGGANTGTRTGKNGGSGGGGAGGTSPAAPGGSGNTPSVSPSQGSDGGDYSTTSPDHGSTGGGGATAAGANKPGGYCGAAGGPGGAGATTAINGTTTGFAGGGGGSAGPGGCASNNFNFPNGRAAAPGTGQSDTLGFGGASGGRPSGFAGSNGTDNKGGGGGGGAGSVGCSAHIVGGSGGSGIVIIRYKIA